MERPTPTPQQLAQLIEQSVADLNKIAEIASNMETYMQEYDLEDTAADEIYTLAQSIYQLAINNKAMLAHPSNYTDGEKYTEDEGTRVYKHAVIDKSSLSNIMSSFLSASSDDEADRHWQLLVSMLKHIAQDSNISNVAIARETGYNDTNVSRIFNLRYCPSMKVFLNVARACRVNFFFESKEAKTDLNILMERAMADLGRRPDKLPKN